MVAHLKKSRANSTNENYESKWKLFAAYAHNKFDTSTTTPAQLAEFLTFLFEKRGVQPTTIKGYRAAIGHVLRLANGYDPGEDDIIRLLMKSFDRQRPVKSRKVPTWDVALVLNQLKQKENQELTFAELQAKAIFLLALATGARRSELWALTKNVQFLGDSCTSMVIPFDKTFVFKTQFTCKNRKFPASLNVQSLGGSESELICPVTTIRAFLQRSHDHRQAHQNSLFIPTRTGADVTTKQLISANVVKVITWAYKRAGKTTPVRVRAHDVRGVATTLALTAGHALEEVLQAGYWTSPHTFYKHYLKSFATQTLNDLQNVPHVVCAGKVIQTDLL